MKALKRNTIPDLVDLARWLVRQDTTLAARRERAVLEELAALLEDFGFNCRLFGYDPADSSRVSLVARLGAQKPGAALCLAGHIDVVPFGSAPWAEDPLSGAIREGRLYGRGSTDMKGGAAALLHAALGLAPDLKDGGLEVHLYGGEEQGLAGSLSLVKDHPEELAGIGAVVVAEPSANRPQAGHKGAFWLFLESHGVTAHSSMPDKGESALAKILPAACRLKDYNPQAAHPYLGKSVATLTTLHSGLNVNSVPDYAGMTLDVRTVAGQDYQALLEQVRGLAGPEVAISVKQEIPPLWTDPDNPWFTRARKIASAVTGLDDGVETAFFSTDGAALRLALPDAPIIVLGPGDPGLAHSTDEFVSLAELADAREIYKRLIADWAGL
ncbi:M20/M25/M40 family metallo-hydrolase [Desulfovibrio sp. OttesenSCG-928-C14]|nr:M20/M25/M40 family metallo-hydrolase [Desulfovibrio sp. OttesenSCG-928-C14]